MTSIGSPSPFFFGGKKAYEVERSLRFNDNDSAYLRYTPSSTSSDRKTWTWSSWVKRGNLSLGAQATIFHSYGSGNQRTELTFETSDTIRFAQGAASSGGSLITTAKFRDVSAWYHIMCVADCSNTTAADRLKIYVNGVIQTDFGTQNNAADSNTQMPTQGVHIDIGSRGGSSRHFDGYMAEINFIDGQALTPSSFAETDSITGQWNPKKYVGSYGTNGFYLNFSDNSGTSATTLGKDSSGNSNNFTPNNFSTSAGAGNDSVEDTPTNNFCTLNPLDKNSNATASDGNLKATGGSAAHYPIFSTFGMKGGKWYAEYRNENNNNWRHAIMNIEHDGGSLDGDSTVANNTSAVNKVGYGLNVSNGQKMHDSDSGSSYGSGLSGTSDVLQCAVDLDNGKIYWGINNTWFNSGDPAAGSNPAFSGIDTTITWTFAHHIYSSNGCTVNFGQQGFSYTPPSGFKALSSANLPDPTIKLPNKHFDTKLYTGNGSTGQTITYEFQPAFVWMKNRDAGNNHALVNAVVGRAKGLYPDSDSAEFNSSTGRDVSAFTSNGFTVGEPEQASSTNNNGSNIVAWAWNAGTSTVTNNDGNNTSQVRASTTAGISILTYTGTGANNTNVTMGHGLGVTPDAVIIKNRDSSSNWVTWHKNLGTHGTYVNNNIFLNTTAAENYYSSQFREANASTITVRDVDSDDNARVNKNGDNYIAFCFSGVSQFSKFGSYVGNSSDNGTFVFTGFSVAWLMVKRANGSNTNWTILDNKRNTFNVTNARLFANSSSAESVSSGGVGSVDFVSNGFKVRDSHQDGNSSSGTYIYFAFAEAPYKNARAR